ncbi:MAG: hypothetical protein HY553_21560 [Elusimicrobia bacterium]|nr:hypothetical protein [Elusimicrobiota bacterium]
MSRARVLLAVAFLAACRRPDPGPAPDGTVRYDDPRGAFSCRVPAEWRVAEENGGELRATFLGPPGGPAPYSTALALLYYGAGTVGPASPRAYAERVAMGEGSGPVVEKRLGDRTVLELRSVRSVHARHRPPPSPRVVERTVVVPAAKGFLVAVHAAPQGREADTAPVFQAMLDSLELR